MIMSFTNNVFFFSFLPLSSRQHHYTTLKRMIVRLEPDPNRVIPPWNRFEPRGILRARLVTRWVLAFSYIVNERRPCSIVRDLNSGISLPESIKSLGIGIF